MSFGFGIGDFIAVGELCWKLYSQVYKVSRNAPEELRGLNEELGNFHNSIQLLLEELKNKDSILSNSGEVRNGIVRRIMLHSGETLNDMLELSKRYPDLQTPSTAQGKRRRLLIYWDRLKFSQEVNKINNLRSKIMLHNSHLTLILQGAQNSSLERIEKQNAQTDRKLDELRRLIVFNPAQRDQPMLTAPLDPNTLMELKIVFLQNAESDNRPCASIGIYSWLQIGQWWLMKAQSQLTVAPQIGEERAIYNQGYANLLKACWILTEVIDRHPQRYHLGASNDRRAHHIQRLTQGAISKLKSLSIITPRLEDLLTCSLEIWNLPISTALTPSRQHSSNQQELKWQTQDGQILFQRFAEYQDDVLKLPIECIVVVELPNEQSADGFNLIVQNSIGQDIFKKSISNEFNVKMRGKDLPINFFTKQDERLLDWIFESLFVTRRSLIPRPVDASMIYSVAILQCCIGANHACFGHTFNFDTAYEDINTLIRSKQQLQIPSAMHISSSFHSMINRAVESYKQRPNFFLSKSDQMFWNLEHHCIWMLIYWLSDSFESFSELFEAFGVRSPIFHPVSQGCLISCSLLKKDTKHLREFLTRIYFNLERVPDNLESLVAAIEEDDIVLLQTGIQNTEREVLIQVWKVLWTCAQYHARFNAMKFLLLVPGMSLVFLFRSLLRLASCDEWREVQTLWNLWSSYIKRGCKISCSLQDCSEMNQSILQKCAELIYKGNLHDLDIFLRIIDGFNFYLDGQDSEVKTYLPILRPSVFRINTQLAILPALASRKLPILKNLLSKHAASAAIESISEKDLDSTTLGHRRPPIKIIHTFQWPLDLAIGLILDSEVVEYLCYHGARLKKSSRDTNFDEPCILRELRLRTTVADARKHSCFVKAECYKVCCMEDNSWIYKKAAEETLVRYESLLTIWKKMCHIIFENDCRDLYDVNNVSSELTWLGIQKQLYPGEPQDASIKKAASWPAPLLTQESWDDWRLHVIDILEKKHQNSLKTSQYGF